MSTELVVRDDSLAPEVIGSAFDLASKVAATEFVPSALRGKPEAIMACILMGREIGVGPMQALSKIHVVDGRPAMAAELMRARALEAGHDLWYEEKTSSRVTVCGRRRGSEHTSKVTWTLDDAKRAGIIGKNNWRKYPRAMLTARATAELCRDLFADCLGGVSYAMEELEDGGFEAVTSEGEPIQAEVPKSRARATVRRESPQRAVAPRSDDGPLLPHELDDSDPGGDIIDAEVVGPDETGDDLDTLTKSQLQLRCKNAGLPVSGNKDELIARLRERASGSSHLQEGGKTGSETSPADGEAVEDRPGEARDEPPADPTRSGQGTPPQQPPPDEDPGEASTATPSEAQRRKLFAVLREHGISDEQRKAMLRGAYNVESLNDLSKGQVAKLIDRLETVDGPAKFAALAEKHLEGSGDDGVPVDAESDRPLSLADRARARAERPPVGYQQRIRDGMRVLANEAHDVYVAVWERLEDITEGRAAQTDWTGASEGRLRELADDVDRLVAELDEEKGGTA